MQSRTSSSKPAEKKTAGTGPVSRTLLLKNLSRFWPLWVLYTAIWLCMGPLAQFVELFGEPSWRQTPDYLANESARLLLEFGTEAGLVMGLVFGCVFAVALFSYLCSARSVGMLHSFPIRREALFWSNYLTGCAVFLAALAMTGLLTAAVQGAAGMLVWENILIWFACAAGQMLFFYSFAVFCAMFTGQVLAIPVFYGILNGLVWGLWSLVMECFAPMFLYGYEGGQSMPAPVSWLTPVYRLTCELSVESEWIEALGYSKVNGVYGLGTVAAYAAAGVVFALLALAAYRLRRSENAGDIVVFAWARRLFRCGVGVCAGLSLGQLLYLLFWQELFYSDGRESLPAVLVFMGLLCLIGYFAAEMLLKKSFRVLRPAWKGAAATALGLILVGACVGMDIAGVEGRVPDPAAVEQVQFSVGGQGYLFCTIEEPAAVARLCQLHQALVDDKEHQLAAWSDAYGSAELVEETGDDGYMNAYIRFQYFNTDGTSMRRSYQFLYQPGELEQAGSLASALRTVVQDPAIQRGGLLRDGMCDPDSLTSGDFSYVARVSPDGGTDYRSIGFDADTARIIFRALLADIDAGRAGATMLQPDGWERRYVNDLNFYYYSSEPDSRGNREVDGWCVEFTADYTETIAALKAMGLVTEERPLITYGEQETWGNADLNGDAVDTIIGGADGPTEVFLAEAVG